MTQCHRPFSPTREGILMAILDPSSSLFGSLLKLFWCEWSLASWISAHTCCCFLPPKGSPQLPVSILVKNMLYYLVSGMWGRLLVPWVVSCWIKERMLGPSPPPPPSAGPLILEEEFVLSEAAIVAIEHRGVWYCSRLAGERVAISSSPKLTAQFEPLPK